MHNLGRTVVLINKSLCFNVQPFCSDVYGDHRRPQTLVEICRNMDICYGFRSMTSRVKYPGFM